MGKATKNEEGKTLKAGLECEGDSKRFDRYVLSDNDKGIVGTIYFAKDEQIPDTLILDVKETE